ncbi:hypothetical protein UA31_10915 [Photobacterium angustum]|nr:hypothetical protein UB36_10910 [Photobacterium damselae subsp. damselae]KJG35370.1 hypothetical protein UA35_21190 [Photobacterium angustum]KJG45198.1 hypothetical protein UA31_10915 [Photobacterium angustum]KJG48709.1 hypothetical protein UA30_11330 [Photobacterium angustum]PSX22714.1 hypothetical protein C0W36_11775 [Photobacterium angustum]
MWALVGIFIFVCLFYWLGVNVKLFAEISQLLNKINYRGHIKMDRHIRNLQCFSLTQKVEGHVAYWSDDVIEILLINKHKSSVIYHNTLKINR